MNQTLVLLIILTIITLVISFLEINKKISLSVGTFIYIFSIFITAFVHTPIPNGDLLRYFDAVNEFKSSSIVNFSYVNSYQGLPVIQFIFWIIARIGILHLLPAISTSTVYSVGIYIIDDFCKRNHKLNETGTLLLYQFMQLPLFSIIENIRNVCAFSLIILAIYRDLIQNKRNFITYVLYVTPCFIHSSAYLLVILRIFLPLLRKLIYALLVIPFFMKQIINFLYLHANIFPKLISNSFIMAYQYLNGNPTEWGIIVKNALKYKSQKIVIDFIVICFIIAFFVLRSKLNKKVQSFCYYIYILLIAVLASNVFNEPDYWRYYSAVVLCIPIFIISIFQIKPQNNILLSRVKFFLALSSIIIFILNSYISIVS